MSFILAATVIMVIVLAAVLVNRPMDVSDDVPTKLARHIRVYLRSSLNHQELADLLWQESGYSQHEEIDRKVDPYVGELCGVTVSLYSVSEESDSLSCEYPYLLWVSMEQPGAEEGLFHHLVDLGLTYAVEEESRADGWIRVREYAPGLEPKEKTIEY